MREHAHLPAMVGFVSKHVAQHFQANRPRPSPAVSAKLLDAAPTPPSASASISAQRAALSANPARACCGVQCARLSCGGTFRCGAVSLTHLARTLCMCVKIAAMVRTLLAGRFGSPGGRVKMFDENLVHAIIGGKDLDCGSAELSVNLVLTRGHCSLLLSPSNFHAIFAVEVRRGDALVDVDNHPGLQFQHVAARAKKYGKLRHLVGHHHQQRLYRR